MQIHIFTDSSQQATYIAGQPVMPTGEEPELYVLLDGRVDAYNESAQLVDTFGPGRCFHARAFFYGDDTITYIAHTDISVQVLNETRLQALLREHPTLAFELLKEAYATREEWAALEKAQESNRRMERLQAARAKAMRKVEQPASQQTPVEQPAPQQAPVVQTPARPSFPKVEKEVEQGTKAAEPGRPALPNRVVVLGGEAPHSPAKKPVVGEDAAKKAAEQPIPAFYLPGHKRHPGETHPEYAAYIFEKEMECPCCRHVFTGWKIFNSKLINKGKPRYDLRNVYKGFAIEWYEVVTCPSCYFSTLLNVFLEPPNLSAGIAQKKLPALRKQVTLEFAPERSLDDVFASHYLALQCADAFLIERQIVAKLWGNISWLYEDAGDRELEQEAAHRAAEANERLFLEGRLTPAQEQMLSLTIAGMLYRANAPKEIRNWLFETKKHKNGKRLFTDLANDLMEELREIKTLGS